MHLSTTRVELLRAQRLISLTVDERSALCRARLNTSRLGFILRSPLPVAESGAEYEALIAEVDARIAQLDRRLAYLDSYANARKAGV